MKQTSTQQNKQTTLILVMLSTLIASVCANGYFSGSELVTHLYGLFATVGHFYLLGLLLLGVPLFFAAFCSHRAFVIASSVMVTFVAVLLTADLMVYSQYRFHINAAMIDLFLHAGDTISFSLEMWFQIVVIAIGLGVFSCLLVYAADKLSKKYHYTHKITGLFLSVFAIAELMYMVAFATYNIDMIVVKNHIPLFQPLTANQFLKKIGLKSKESAVAMKGAKKRLNYPLKDLAFARSNAARKNIVFLLADSLRGDVFTPEIMPKIGEWSKDQIVLSNHYSSSNGTRSGIFGLFYSLPPNYWHAVLSTRTPPVFVTTLQNQGYDIQAFATATLDHPEFTDTVFSTVRPIRIGSTKSSVDADIESVEDFESYLHKRKTSGTETPFFAFVFLDTTHGYSHPKEYKRFKPAWDNPKYMKLTNDTDPLPMMNLYKNSAFWTDELFSRVINAIKNQGIMDNTIIVVTSDHGQEINDSKKNFWGHNSAYNDAQTKIPAIVHWPGKQSYIEENWTIAYDIPMTILKEELGLQSELSDVGIGLDLFGGNLSNRKWFLMGGYSDVAIREKDRIIEIDEMGLLKFYDNNYNKHAYTNRTPNIFDALELMSKYLKR